MSGRVIAGLHRQNALAGSRIFQGGTCLEKCYFETCPFSEEPDATLSDPSQVVRDFLTGIFCDVGDWIDAQTGVEFPEDLQEFDIFENCRGNASCQGLLQVMTRTGSPACQAQISSTMSL